MESLSMPIVIFMREKIKKNKWYLGAVSLWALSVVASGRASFLTTVALVVVAGFIGYEVAGERHD